MEDTKELMSLDEAIQHCHEVTNNCENEGCSLNHRQLAHWPEELKLLKSVVYRQ